MRYINTMEYYSAAKRNRLFIHSHNHLDGSQMHIAKWKKPHQERLHNVWFHLFGILERAKQETEKVSVVVRVWEWEESGVDYKNVWGDYFFFWVIKLICIVTVVGVIFLYATVKTHILIINYTTKSEYFSMQIIP